MATNGVEAPKQKGPLSLQGIRAIIFDMDDLMIHSHHVHMKVFERVLGSYGIAMSANPMTKEEEAAQFGRTIPDILQFFHGRYGLPQNVTVEEMNRRFKENLLPTFRGLVQPMEGLHELIEAFKSKGYKLALASSSGRAKIDIVLDRLHLSKSFDAIVSGEDDSTTERPIRGKPAPDIFITAADKLGVKYNVCLVLEDAKNGVEAGKAGGMRVVGVHNKHTLEDVGVRQDLSAADLQTNSLTEVLEYFFSKNPSQS